MGANSRYFLETRELEEMELYGLLNREKDFIKDWGVFRNFDELYKEDENFRKLCSQEKKIKIEKIKYYERYNKTRNKD